MKRCISIVFLVVCMFVSFGSVNVSAQGNGYNFVYDNINDGENKKQDITKSFFEMQNKITDTLTISGNKYLYDESVITDIVSNFDINQFNETFGLDYTVEDLVKEFIFLISDFEVQPKTRVTTEAYTCNLNKDYNEWNYKREYRDDQWTNKIINTYDKVSDYDMIIALLSILGLSNHPIASLGVAYLQHWAAEFVDSLGSVNLGCGTVVDYNTFSANLLYYEAAQQYFPGHF